MQKDKQFYDDFFTNHDVNIHNNSDRFMAVSNLLSGRILDIACGTGTLADYYAGDYVGVDISDIAIASAREVRRKDAKFLTADFSKVNIEASEKFDCVYLGEFLEHIENDVVVFANIKEILLPNGKIVATVPNGERVPDESHCRLFSVPQIRREYSKYGKITFHNWSGFHDRILFTIEPAKQNLTILSLVMMCKNEAKGIENAILSCIGIVDNIVIAVDTATKDKTRAIAEMYADVVKDLVWQDDFSYGRNFAQEGVNTKWSLFLDGHEYLEKTCDIESLLALDVDGLLTTIKMENGATFMYPRIFRSHLKFENAVHNAVDVKTKEFAPNFVIVHDRANAQSLDSIQARVKQRDKMIPEIMQKMLKENPKNQRALFNLANWYMTQNNLKLAIETYKRCYKLTPSPDERYFIKAQIGIAYQLSNCYFRALWSFFDLEKLIPGRWETKRLLGGVYLQRGQYKKALVYFVFALDANKKQYLYQLFGQDFAEIWDLIASCFNELGQPAKAVIAWEQAMEETKDEKRKAFFATKSQLARMLVR